jgi:hypothetical protein
MLHPTEQRPRCLHRLHAFRAIRSPCRRCYGRPRRWLLEQGRVLFAEKRPSTGTDLLRVPGTNALAAAGGSQTCCCSGRPVGYRFPATRCWLGRPTPCARSFSSGTWGRCFESAARRPRARPGRQHLSRYSRFDDGHPSPSPNREWMHLGIKGTSLTTKNPSGTATPPTGARLTATDDDQDGSVPEQRAKWASISAEASKKFPWSGPEHSDPTGPAPEPRIYRRFERALCRTRTDDPFLTMEVLYQLS